MLFARDLLSLNTLSDRVTGGRVAKDSRNCRRFMRDAPRTRPSLLSRESGTGNWSGEGSTGHTPASKSKSLSVSSHDSAGISARFENRARPSRHVECICAHPSRRAINGKFRIGPSYGDSLLSAACFSHVP